MLRPRMVHKLLAASPATDILNLNSHSEAGIGVKTLLSAFTGTAALFVSYPASVIACLSLFSPATDIGFEHIYLSSENHQLVQGQS